MRSSWKGSRFLALVAIFASLSIVSDSIVGIPQFSSGVWYSWIFVTEPLTGLILPPYAGFLSTFIGVMAGHIIYPRDTYEFLFTIGAPIGSMITGLMFSGKHKIVLVYFAALLAAYFVTPVSWQLPLWGMWDTYIAFAVVLVANFALPKIRSVSRRRTQKMLPFFLALFAFIGLEADILFRIFLFVPCQTYRLLFGFTVEELRIIWVAGAVITPIQVALSAIFTSTIGVPLLKITRRMDLEE